MTPTIWIAFPVVMLLLITNAQCLRNVTLQIIPEVVERGHEVILRCHYILEDTHLYSLKWYRGKYEFYRFSPKESPPTKIFNIPGIEVDIQKSNESEVTIKNVEFGLSGNFCCEVTGDAPTYSTESATKRLDVVALPASRPVITAERRRYELGDTLKANCSLPPSKPAVEFSFTINNIPISSSSNMPNEKVNNYMVKNAAVNGGTEWQWSEINLTLQSYHYSGGQLNLRCIAQIPDIYKAITDVSLNAWEPVPERVTSDNASSISKMGVSMMLYFYTLQFLFR